LNGWRTYNRPVVIIMKAGALPAAHHGLELNPSFTESFNLLALGRAAIIDMIFFEALEFIQALRVSEVWKVKAHLFASPESAVYV